MAGVAVGLLGCGQWGRHLARNFAALGVLRAVSDPDPLVIRTVREQYPAVAATDDGGTLLDDPALSALVIATPAALHFELARRALEAGKDVFVEKPLALTVKDGEALVELAERRGRILMVGHVLEYHPAIDRLRARGQRRPRPRPVRVLESAEPRAHPAEENVLWSFAPHDIPCPARCSASSAWRWPRQGGSYLKPRSPM